MKAIVYDRYGPPHVLSYREVVKPTPGPDQVLVRVYAASLNASDKHLLRGNPLLIRLMGFGFFKPKNKILGADMAGQVEAVGKNIKLFVAGDNVFGDLSDCGFGAFAEYVAVPEHALLLKPDTMTFAQAAALPLAAVTALQGLRDKGGIQPGKKVLINGAAGGVGSFALQIAKAVGAEVTAVGSSDKLAMLRSLGADHIIDYSKEDFTKSGEGYDLIFEAAGYRSILDYRQVLNPGGVFVMVGGSMARLFQLMLLGPWISMIESKLLQGKISAASMRKGKKLLLLAAKPAKKDLLFICSLFAAGKLTPVIDRQYNLMDLAAAISYLEAGHVQGKIVIRV